MYVCVCVYIYIYIYSDQGNPDTEDSMMTSLGQKSVVPRPPAI